MPERLSFDRVASIYDETRSLSPKAMSHVLGILVDELLGKKVLEIGVGTGRYAVPLQKSGIDVVGVDISQKMVDQGLSKGMHSVILADGVRLPFVARSFDLTMTNHVLHLLPDWRDMLLEIARVTRDSYLSVLERAEEQSGLQKEYNDLVRKAGHEVEHPGVRERDLPGLLKPDLVMPVGPFNEVLAAEPLLGELEARSFSAQWNVPEAIHRQTMATMRARWAGREVHHRYSLEISFWQVGRLVELAKAPAQRS